MLMDKKNIAILCCSICISFLSGFAIGKFVNKKEKHLSKTFGNLRIDTSEENEPPMIFLELKCSKEELFSANKISLDVVKKNYV